MRTLIISDLHLGSTSGADVLRTPAVRAELIKAVADVDRVVLLGDVIELRHGPPGEAMDLARPFFEELGAALAGRELVLTAGNHDHALIEPWLETRSLDAEPGPLGVEQVLDPAEASAAFELIARWARPASVRVAYPGLWVRPDVYATHGHYLDSHLTVPTLERLSVGVMSRILHRPASTFSGADDYEAVGSPVFAWRDAVARSGRTGESLNGMATVTAWRALSGTKSRSRPWRVRTARRAVVAAFPPAVAILNRAGIGPLSASVSPGELRRAGLSAMGEVAARLGLGDAHVIFGHTHRAGPLPGDEEGEWVGRAGARLVNTGSWTYSPVFMGGSGRSPYWPGCCVLVADSGPPEVLSLLDDLSAEQLAPAEQVLAGRAA
jgi:predicted phosphodiesterase